MPGFYISSKNVDFELINRYSNRCLVGSININNGTMKRHTLNKFMQDKAFFETSELACVTEGVILNLADLKKEYNTNSVNELVQVMYGILNGAPEP